MYDLNTYINENYNYVAFTLEEKRNRIRRDLLAGRHDFQVVGAFMSRIWHRLQEFKRTHSLETQERFR